MLCFQTHSASFADAIINHPDIRPTIERGAEPLSSAGILHDLDNVVLAGLGGLAVFTPVGQGVFKGHIMLLRGSRGVHGLAFGHKALQTMFEAHKASKVTAAVPLELSAARWYVRRLGFTSFGVAEDGLQELFELEAFNGHQ